MTNFAKCLIYKCLAFLVFCVPLVILFIANHDEYGTKASAVGFWAYIILIFCVIAFKETVLSVVRKHTLISVCLAVFVTSLVMHFLADRFMLISGVALIGACLQEIVDSVADTYRDHSYIVAADGTKTRNTAPAIPDRQAWRETYGLRA